MLEIKASGGSDEFAVSNIYEQLVSDSVLEMMEKVNMCKCAKCVSDVCALVLNQIMPQYVTTKKGELMSKLPQSRPENQVDLTVKVVQAIEMVKNSPQH